MVRLNPVDPELAGQQDADGQYQDAAAAAANSNHDDPGAQAQVVDDLMANYRSKPQKSSLDYKAPEGGGDQVLPPPKNDDNNNVIELDPETFAGMSQEEILQKIKEHDPEFARQMAEAAAKKAQSTANAPTNAPSGPPTKKSQRLEQLGIEQGRVPVTQWAILLVLMAYGAWRLYASKQGAANAATAKKAAGNRGITKSNKAVVKNKGHAKTKSYAAAAAGKANAKDVPKKSVKDDAGGANKKKKNNKPKSQPAVSFKEESSSDSDSSSDRDAKVAPTKRPKSPEKKKTMAQVVASNVDAPMEEGWQTVKANGVPNSNNTKKTKANGSASGKNAAGSVEPETAVAPAESAVAAEDMAAKPENGTAAPAPVTNDSGASDGFVASKAAKKKKKKKTKSEDNSSSSQIITGTPNTDSDAALAARLQEAENNADTPVEEDEWAEVTNKSKKREKVKEPDAPVTGQEVQAEQPEEDEE